MSLFTIAARDVDSYIGKNNAIIIDMRSYEEYKRGHIAGAINMPYNEDNWSINCLKDRTIIIYCDRGNLSLQIGRKLSAQGYQIISVYGGINAYRGKLAVD